MSHSTLNFSKASVRMKAACLIIFVIVGIHTAFGQSAPAMIADSLQAILDKSLPASFSKPGAVMGIVVPGQWSWFGSSGNAIAGITSGQPATLATPTTQFRVGSITKNMVAACILKLEQEGKLSIDDAIDKYLRPTLVNDTIAASDTVRIRHLLNHTSGISNSADNTSCQMDVLTNPLNSHSLEEAIYCGTSQGEIFPPGFAWAYSNTNYSILAMIIKNITGISCADYIRQNIITPLGLTHTEIPVTNQISSAHMGCYWNIGNWIDLTIINPSTYTGWADVVSSTQDLTTYYQALLNGTIINATELARMKTIDPASFDYGMGLDFYKFSGSDYYGHYGEVANTSGMFFGNIQTVLAPNGYYIAYNFNTQGVDMQTMIDQPVMNLLKSTQLSVSEPYASIEASLFPNPSEGLSFLKLVNPHQGLELSITGIEGKVYYEESISSGVQNVSLDTKNLNSGIYFVNLRGTASSCTLKLMVRK